MEKVIKIRLWNDMGRRCYKVSLEPDHKIVETKAEAVAAAVEMAEAPSVIDTEEVRSMDVERMVDEAYNE